MLPQRDLTQRNDGQGISAPQTCKNPLPDEIARTRHPDSYGVVRYRHESGGATTAVLSPPGRKWLHYVAIDDSPIRLHRVPISEYRWCTEMDYQLQRACRLMLDAETRLGITKGARDFLKRALSAGVLPGSTPRRYAKNRLEPAPLLASETDCENDPSSNKGSVSVTADRPLCARCKQPFNARRSSARFCSARCKQRVYRARAAA